LTSAQSRLPAKAGRAVTVRTGNALLESRVPDAPDFLGELGLPAARRVVERLDRKRLPQFARREDQPAGLGHALRGAEILAARAVVHLVAHGGIDVEARVR